MVSVLYPDLKKSYSDSKYCQKLDFLIHAYMLKDFCSIYSNFTHLIKNWIFDMLQSGDPVIKTNFSPSASLLSCRRVWARSCEHKESEPDPNFSKWGGDLGEKSRRLPGREKSWIESAEKIKYLSGR